MHNSHKMLKYCLVIYLHYLDRSPLLLLCSAISGFVILSYMASRNLFDRQIPCPTTYYLGVFCFVLLLVPHLLRCYRLLVIFNLSVAKAALHPNLTSPRPSFTSFHPSPSSTPIFQERAAHLSSSSSVYISSTSTTPVDTLPTLSSPDISPSPSPRLHNSSSILRLSATSTTYLAQESRSPSFPAPLIFPAPRSTVSANLSLQDIKKKGATYAEIRLLKILAFFAIILAIVLVVIQSSLSKTYLNPGTTECDTTERYVILTIIGIMIILDFVFVFLIYKMKHVTDGFSINNELKMVCLAQVLHGTCMMYLQSTREHSWPYQPFIGV